MESVAIVFGDERQADGFFFRKTICGSGTERVEARPGKHDLRQQNKNCVWREAAGVTPYSRTDGRWLFQVVSAEAGGCIRQGKKRWYRIGIEAG